MIDSRADTVLRLADLIAPQRLPYRVDDPLRTSTLCLILTNRCNIECEYCFNYVSENSQHVDMAPGLAVAILKMMIEYNSNNVGSRYIPHIIFFGGEPTLNGPAIDAVLDGIDSLGIDCIPRLVTNGIMPSATLERHIKQLLYFQLSYDGTDDEQRHFKLVETSPRDQVVKTIKRILKAELPVFLRATIHAGNVGKMTEIVRFASEVGAQAVSFAPICDEGNAATRLVPRPTITEYVENFFAAFDLARRLNIGFYSAEVHTVSSNAQQFYPPLVVLPDGYVCFSIKVASSSAPNARDVIAGKFRLEGGHLALEWYEDLVRERIANFAANQERHCFRCRAYEGCKGKRAFDTFCSTPDLKGYDDYYCEITRRIFDGLMNRDLTNYKIF